MTGREYRTVGYSDELLAGGTVRRSYTDDRQEWRRRVGRTVEWRDNRGRTGVDEPLGNRVVKRRFHNGEVVYGRELGFGRTAWGDGVLTVNRTSMGGRVGAIMAGIGAAGLLPLIVDPPQSLTAEEEEALRQQAAQGSGSSGDSWDSAGDGADPADDDWSDPGGGSDDDFG